MSGGRSREELELAEMKTATTFVSISAEYMTCVDALLCLGTRSGWKNKTEFWKTILNKMKINKQKYYKLKTEYTLYTLPDDHNPQTHI